LVINEYDERKTIDRDLFERLSGEYPEALAPDQIPRSQDITNAQQQGCTIFGLEQPSQTARRARSAYQANARELLARMTATAESGAGSEVSRS
jgi:chromosome partitioning protein